MSKYRTTKRTYTPNALQAELLGIRAKVDECLGRVPHGEESFDLFTGRILEDVSKKLNSFNKKLSNVKGREAKRQKLAAQAEVYKRKLMDLEKEIEEITSFVPQPSSV